MIIEPVLAPALSNLTATATIKGNQLKWKATDAVSATEIWASQTNNRLFAARVAEIWDNSFMHIVDSGAPWYYWIRAVSVHKRADGEWLPLSPTGGLASTPALAGTADIQREAATGVILKTDTATSSSAYDTWQTLIYKYFYGTGPVGYGNPTFLYIQNEIQPYLTTVGTTGYANTEHRMQCVQYSCYKTGTVSTTAGSAVVTGTGTNWLSSSIVASGAILHDSMDQEGYSIASVDSDTQLTLSSAIGVTYSNIIYFIRATTSSPIIQLDQITNHYELHGTSLHSYHHPYANRWMIRTVDTSIVYRLSLLWRMVRTDPSWDISNISNRRLLLIEDIKL